MSYPLPCLGSLCNKKRRTVFQTQNRNTFLSSGVLNNCVNIHLMHFNRNSMFPQMTFNICTALFIIVAPLLFLSIISWSQTHMKKSFLFVHRPVGSGRRTSVPWRLSAWQRSRSSMTASILMLHAPTSSGTIRLWWYVPVWLIRCIWQLFVNWFIFLLNLSPSPLFLSLWII